MSDTETKPQGPAERRRRKIVQFQDNTHLEYRAGIVVLADDGTLWFLPSGSQTWQSLSDAPYNMPPLPDRLK